MTNTPLILKEIPKDEAISFIRQYHYSKILPRLCKYFLGIFSEEKLLGVVELG
ncbi:Mom family adenine methylcarbamoylation protein, partial [Staphylococcus aureus]